MTGPTNSQTSGQPSQGSQNAQQGQSGAPSPADLAQAAQRAGQGQGQSQQTFTPPASQEELDRIIGERLARERGKYADYDDLKAKAEKYDEVESKNKTEAERLADELAKAQERAQSLEAQAVRARVAAESGLPLELITGSNEEQCRAQAEAAKKLLDERKPSSGWGKQVGAGSGGAAAVSTDPLRQFINSKR